MEINSLVILGNEFCNYNCEHCLRGPSRNNRMTRETLEKFLSQVSNIYEITFTGGEVTLYLEPIRWFIDICREKDIYVGGFYIVTNGHKYVPELIDLMNETIYEFSEIKNDWDEYLKIMKNPNIWDFFFDGHYGYYDEYDKCEDCQCVYMNPAMDYSYYKEGILFEYEGEVKYLCKHCLQNYKKEYLETLENNPKNWCNMFTVEECEQSGYKEVSITFEHGLYGRTASPETILKTWLELYPDDRFIFVRTDENPFACEFILMKKINKNEEE